LPELLLPPPDFDPPLLELPPPFFELLLPLLLEPPLPDLPLLLLSFLLVGITSILLIYCCRPLGRN